MQTGEGPSVVPSGLGEGWGAHGASEGSGAVRGDGPTWLVGGARPALDPQT